MAWKCLDREYLAISSTWKWSKISHLGLSTMCHAFHISDRWWVVLLFWQKTCCICPKAIRNHDGSQCNCGGPFCYKKPSSISKMQLRTIKLVITHCQQDITWEDSLMLSSRLSLRRSHYLRNMDLLSRMRLTTDRDSWIGSMQDE